MYAFVAGTLQFSDNSIISLLYNYCFPGSILEKAGGSEFKEEVKKLSESNGPLELTEGKC